MSRNHLPHLFYIKEIFLANNKTFEHANLIFTETWALVNEIIFNIMQNFKFEFFENDFWAGWCVRFKFHFQNLT